MFFWVVRAYVTLISFEILMRRYDFKRLRERVSAYPIKQPSRLLAEDRICTAVNIACLSFWKRVLCLQRSAVTTCLLRKAGISAELVLGARALPFRAHAWVEVGERVVNDKSYIREDYQVLDRF